ncbi:MAG: hypothetical protein ACC651_07865 [Candidatus Scalindua sp.]
MREPIFLKEIHENQLKAHEKRVNKGMRLNDYMKLIEKNREYAIKHFGLKISKHAIKASF